MCAWEDDVGSIKPDRKVSEVRGVQKFSKNQIPIESKVQVSSVLHSFESDKNFFTKNTNLTTFYPFNSVVSGSSRLNGRRTLSWQDCNCSELAFCAHYPVFYPATKVISVCLTSGNTAWNICSQSPFWRVTTPEAVGSCPWVSFTATESFTARVILQDLWDSCFTCQ